MSEREERNGPLRDFAQELEGVEQSLKQVRGLLKKAQDAEDEQACLKYQSGLEKLELTRDRIRQKIADYRRDIQKIGSD